MTDTPTPEPKVIFGPAKLKHKWHDDTDYFSDPVMEGDEQWVGRFKSDTGCEVKSTNFIDSLHHAMLARIAELEQRPDNAELNRLKDIADCARDLLHRFPPFFKEEWDVLADSNDDAQFLRMRIGRLTEAIERDIEAYNESINPDSFFITEADLLAVAERAAANGADACLEADNDRRYIGDTFHWDRDRDMENAAAQAVAEWREARTK